MNATLEEQVANLPPRLTAAQHNAFPHGRYAFEESPILKAPVICPPSPRPSPPGEGVVITPPPGFLAPEEVLELQFCERSIEHGLETFLEVGLALSTIREQRLYRGTFKTFEDYCQQRWEMKASRARQLCAASEVMRNLKAETQKGQNGIMPVLPTSERQVRPLMSLAPDQQTTVWKEAVATAPNGKVTSAHVADVAARVTGKHRPKSNVIEAGTKTERLKAVVDSAIANVREAIDLQGTADSEAASNVFVSLSQLETFKEHLKRVEQLQGARA